MYRVLDLQTHMSYFYSPKTKRRRNYLYDTTPWKLNNSWQPSKRGSTLNLTIYHFPCSSLICNVIRHTAKIRWLTNMKFYTKVHFVQRPIYMWGCYYFTHVTRWQLSSCVLFIHATVCLIKTLTQSYISVVFGSNMFFCKCG